MSISSTTAKQTQMCPMPDMSAFESTGASFHGDRTSDDSLIKDSKGLPTLPRRLCPPTPVRTPAWASDTSVFASGRQNPLISTKVLLACPSHVLEGRNSLENSLLKEDCQLAPTDSTTSIAYQNVPDVRKDEERPTSVSQDKNGAGSQQLCDVSLRHDKSMTIPQLSKDLGLVSFSYDFEVLGSLGSGAFADGFKVRSTVVSMRSNEIDANFEVFATKIWR